MGRPHPECDTPPEGDLLGRIASVDGRHPAYRAFDVNRKYNFLLVRTRVVACVQTASAAVLPAGFLRGLSREPLIQQVAYTASGLYGEPLIRRPLIWRAAYTVSRLYGEPLIQ